MDTRTLIRFMVVGLVAGLVMLPSLPTRAEPEFTDPNWLQAIMHLTLTHRELAKAHGKEQAYHPYLEQLQRAHESLAQGDTRGTYLAMMQFMDMLEQDAASGRGIPKWSARVLFEFCGRVTPPRYHDVSRHQLLL